MNEKFKKLKEQALKDCINETDPINESNTITLREFHDFVEQKFAELIVEECIMICKSHKIQSTDDVWYLAHNETINAISENIEEYFGVEE